MPFRVLFFLQLRAGSLFVDGGGRGLGFSETA